MATNSNKSDWQPSKEREYRLYLLWRSMPVKMLKLGQSYLKKLGIDDPDIAELVGIKYQQEFAKKFGLSIDTLTDWNQKPTPPEYKDIDWRVWAKQLTRNVIGYLYEGIEREKDAARIKLWLQAVDNYVEETKVTGDASKETLAGIRGIVEALNNRGQNGTNVDAGTSTDDNGKDS